jgi:hypothetical protein
MVDVNREELQESLPTSRRDGVTGMVVSRPRVGAIREPTRREVVQNSLQKSNVTTGSRRAS